MTHWELRTKGNKLCVQILRQTIYLSHNFVIFAFFCVFMFEDQNQFQIKYQILVQRI
jgi:hypothetical protein